jgi:hypothetical protein
MDSLYEPHANQIKIHQSRAQNRVVVAGRRFGKSALGLNEALARAFQLKDQIIWIILPQYRQAKEIYWIDPDITKYFMPYVQAGLIKKDDSELSLHVKLNNSWIRLKGSDNYNSLRGSGLDLVIWDEVADVKEEAFDTIKPALADSPYHRQLYIGTPKGLNWFHDFALRGDHSHEINTFGKDIKQSEDWETWHFTSYDNMSWPEGSIQRIEFVKYIDKQREEAIEKGKLPFFNQEYMASFEESAGRFFPTWSPRTHVLDGIFIPQDKYKRFGTIDWGRAAPFAWYAHCIVPIEYEGKKFNRIITFNEVYDTNKSPYEHAEHITKLIDYKTISKTYCDPSMETPQSDGSLSVIDQFRYSFRDLTGSQPNMMAASNKRVSRWAAIDNWVRMAEDGLPYWMVTRACPNLIRTIPLMEPDPNDINDLNSDLEDHGIDSASYGIQHQTWVDSKVGATHSSEIKMPHVKNKRPLMRVDLDAWATGSRKSKRDWGN